MALASTSAQRPVVPSPLPIANPVLLAPMAGVTDVPFRRAAWRGGVGYMVGEMVSSRPELWSSDKSRLRRERVDGAPHAIQLAGSEPGWLADAARRHVEAGAEIIDINFGCPAKKVCRKAAGSALLETPDLVVDIARAVVDAVDVPVTIKTRTGPTPHSDVVIELGQRLQDAGVAALALHGRSRACRFVGPVDHGPTARLVRRLSIPVFANGDIDTFVGARAVLQQTGAAGVMIGRAALGAPWLPGWLAKSLAAGCPLPTPSVSTRLRELRGIVVDMHAFYGVPKGLRIARKHIQWTLGHATLDAAARQRLAVFAQQAVRADAANEQLDMLDAALEAGVESAAADRSAMNLNAA
ncbi:MAG: tRNA dihydrouridine synthase DusB [Pseudomonadota bacterium]